MKCLSHIQDMLMFSFNDTILFRGFTARMISHDAFAAIKKQWNSAWGHYQIEQLECCIDFELAQIDKRWFLEINIIFDGSRHGRLGHNADQALLLLAFLEEESGWDASDPVLGGYVGEVINVGLVASDLALHTPWLARRSRGSSSCRDRTTGPRPPPEPGSHSLSWGSSSSKPSPLHCVNADGRHTLDSSTGPGPRVNPKHKMLSVIRYFAWDVPYEFPKRCFCSSVFHLSLTPT